MKIEKERVGQYLSDCEDRMYEELLFDIQTQNLATLRKRWPEFNFSAVFPPKPNKDDHYLVEKVGKKYLIVDWKS